MVFGDNFAPITRSLGDIRQNSFGCFQKWSVQERLQSVHDSPSFEASDCMPNKDSRSLTAAFLYCNFFVGRDIKSWKQHNSSSMGLGFPKNILSESPPPLIAYFRREETLWIGRCRRCHQWFLTRKSMSCGAREVKRIFSDVVNLPYVRNIFQNLPAYLAMDLRKTYSVCTE